MVIKFPYPDRINLDYGISIIPQGYEWFRYTTTPTDGMDMCRADFIVVWNDNNNVNHYFPFATIRVWDCARVINAICDAHLVVSHDLLSCQALNDYYNYRLGINYKCQQNDMFFGALKRNLRGKLHVLRLNTCQYNEFKRRLSRMVDSMVPLRQGERPISEDYESYVVHKAMEHIR